MKHLFEQWARVRPVVEQAEALLVMLDFDGTLAPIVEHPDQAALPELSRQRLARLAGRADVAAAIISGRAVADVRRRVGLDGLDYVGNHGRERLRAGAAEVEVDAAVSNRMNAVAGELEKLFAEVPGIYIENKGLTVAAHYRQAPSEYEGRLRGLVEEFVQQRDKFLRLCEGKKVFDLFPLDRLDKGSAVTSLLAEQGGPAHALPIYCGDDATDETAFAVLGPEAITVYVGAGDRASRARFRLSDPDEVGELIDRLDVCRREKSDAG